MLGSLFYHFVPYLRSTIFCKTFLLEKSKVKTISSLYLKVITSWTYFFQTFKVGVKWELRGNIIWCLNISNFWRSLPLSLPHKKSAAKPLKKKFVLCLLNLLFLWSLFSCVFFLSSEKAIRLMRVSSCSECKDLKPTRFCAC